jgi:hypothetical protein
MHKDGRFSHDDLVFGFELSKFVGKQRLDFLFIQAEMQGFGNELLHGGANL